MAENPEPRSVSLGAKRKTSGRRKAEEKIVEPSPPAPSSVTPAEKPKETEEEEEDEAMVVDDDNGEKGQEEGSGSESSSSSDSSDSSEGSDSDANPPKKTKVSEEVPSKKMAAQTLKGKARLNSPAGDSKREGSAGPSAKVLKKGLQKAEASEAAERLGKARDLAAKRLERLKPASQHAIFKMVEHLSSIPEKDQEGLSRGFLHVADKFRAAKDLDVAQGTHTFNGHGSSKRAASVISVTFKKETRSRY